MSIYTRSFSGREPELCTGDIIRAFPWFVVDSQRMAVVRRSGDQWNGQPIGDPRHFEADPSDLLSLPVEIQPVIILSCTCDIESDGKGYILYSPVFPAGRYLDRAALERARNNLNRTPIWAMFLPGCNKAAFPESIVDFNIVCTVMKSDKSLPALTFGLANRWLRMKPPFREALASRFGAYHGRVGLNNGPY